MTSDFKILCVYIQNFLSFLFFYQNNKNLQVNLRTVEASIDPPNQTAYRCM